MDWNETFEIAVLGLSRVLRIMIIALVSLTLVVIVGLSIYYVYKRRKQRSSH
jgi:hypothetical protein